MRVRFGVGAVLLLAAPAVWASTKGVAGIDIIVKKHPTGKAAIAVRTDANGVFSVPLAEPGSYSMIAYLTDAGAADLVSTGVVRMTASITRKEGGDPIRLTAIAGAPGGNRLETEVFDVPEPAVIRGLIAQEQRMVSTDDVVFTAVSGGPPAPDRSIEIVAEGISEYTYTVRVSEKYPVRVAVSPAEGRGNRQTRPVIRMTPPRPGFEPNTYPGLVEVTIRPAGGTPIVENIGVTYDIRRPGEIGLVSDRREYVLPPAPPASANGAPRLATVMLTLTNPDSADQVLRMGYEKPSDQVMFRFPQPTFRIAPGGTVRVPVEVNREALAAAKAGGEERKCVTVTNDKGQSHTYYLLEPIQDTLKPLPTPPGLIRCRPSRLLPVLARAPNRMRVGAPAEFEIEAVDDCGNAVEDFVFQLTAKSGGVSASGKAITKTGSTSGFLPVSPDTSSSAGVVVVAEKSTEAGKLTGRAEFAIATDPNPGTVLIRGVTNIDGTLVASPGSLIRVSLDAPGTPVLATPPGSPLPKELGGIAVLANGEPQGILSVSPTEAVVQLLGIGEGVREIKVGLGNCCKTSKLVIAPVTPRLVPFTVSGSGPAFAAKRRPGGEWVPLVEGERAVAGDIIAVAAAGLGENPAAEAARIVIGDKEAPARKCSSCTFPTETPGTVYLEAEVPEGVQSIQRDSGLTAIQVLADGVHSPEEPSFFDAATEPPVKFVTTAGPVPYDYDGVSTTGAVKRKDAPYSEHTIDAPQSFGPSSILRWDRTAWFTTDPTATAPPAGTPSYKFLLPQQAQLPTTWPPFVPIYGADYQESHYLDVSVDQSCGSASISANPPSPDGFYPAGTAVQLTIAGLPSGTILNNWTGGADASGKVTLPAAGPVTAVCSAASLTFTLNTSVAGPKPGLSVWFSSGGGTSTGTAGAATGPAATPVNLYVAKDYVTPSTGLFSFFNSTSNPSVTWSASGNVYYGQYNASNPAQVTANYTGACVIVAPTVAPSNGGTININGTLYTQNGAPPSCFALSSNLSLTATPAPGFCFAGWTNQQNASASANPLQAAVNPSNGSTPPNPVANFGPCTSASIAVNTNPANIGVTVGLSGSGSAVNSFTPSSFTAGAATVTATPASISNAANDTRYDFKNWSLNGVPNPAWNATAQAVTLASSGGVYTANYDALYRVSTSVTGNCTMTPGTGFYPAGTQLTVNVTLPSGVQLTSLTFGSQALNNGAVLTVNGPGLLSAVCAAGQQIPVTVGTNPANIGVTVGVANSSTLNLHTASLAPGSPQTVTATPQALLAGNGTYYQFQNWTPSGPAVTLPATGVASYTANYQAAGYSVTTSGCGMTVGPLISAIQTNPLVFPAGSNVVIAANPPTGQQFQSFQVTIAGNSTTVTTNPATIALTGPAVITANCGAPSNVTLTVTSNPVGLGVRIGTSSAFAPGPISQQIPANQSTTIEAAGTQVLSGTGYRFANWSTGGATTATSVQPTANLTATANYTVACHTLTVNTTGAGTVAVTPQSNIAGFPNNCYAPGTTVVLTANPNTGNTFTSWSGDASGSTSPTSVTMDAPKTVTATFGQAQNVTVTLATNPAGLGVRFGASGNFAPGPITQQVPANQSTAIEAGAAQVLNGTGYRFTGWSTGASTAAATIQPAANLTATANFQVACHIVDATGSAGGTVALNPASGNVAGFPANCYAPGTQVRILATANTGFGLRDVVINVGGTPSTVTTPNTPVSVAGPVTAVATFIPRPGTVSTIFPPVLVSGNTYRDNIFFSNPTPTPGNSLQIINVTFTTTGGTGAVTLVSPLPIVFGALPANGQSSTQQIQFNIPSTVTNYDIFVTVEVKNANGDTFTNVVSVGQTVPAAQNVTLAVASNPAGLGVRIGASGAFTAAPVSQQVPAGSTQTIAADTPQVVNGTGYRFTGWSTGGAAAVTTVQPAANLTATANFQTACHLVNLTGSQGGTVALNPASGGVTGFPANCFAPGSQVRLLATANTGFGLRDVVINNGGSTSTVTTPNTLITVNGPVTATATFIPRPGTVSTIFPPTLVSGTTYRSNIFFSNPTPTAGSNLRITNVTFSTTGGSGSASLITTLPVVFGALPANGQSSTQQLQFNLPTTLTAYNIFVTVEVQNANGDTFTNVVSVGHTKP